MCSRNAGRCSNIVFLSLLVGGLFPVASGRRVRAGWQPLHHLTRDGDRPERSIPDRSIPQRYTYSPGKHFEGYDGRAAADGKEWQQEAFGAGYLRKDLTGTGGEEPPAPRTVVGRLQDVKPTVDYHQGRHLLMLIVISLLLLLLACCCLCCLVGAREMDGVEVTIRKAEKLAASDLNGKCDPYVVCQVAKKPDTKFETPVVNKNPNPEWNHAYRIRDITSKDELVFTVMGQDFGPNPDDVLGTVTLPASKFRKKTFVGELPLTLLDGAATGARGALRGFLHVKVEPIFDTEEEKKKKKKKKDQDNEPSSASSRA